MLHRVGLPPKAIPAQPIVKGLSRHKRLRWDSAPHSNCCRAYKANPTCHRFKRVKDAFGGCVWGNDFVWHFAPSSPKVEGWGGRQLWRPYGWDTVIHIMNNTDARPLNLWNKRSGRMYAASIGSRSHPQHRQRPHDLRGRWMVTVYKMQEMKGRTLGTRIYGPQGPSAMRSRNCP